MLTCRKLSPPARNYAVARLAADVGLRINETRMLDLDDVRCELGRFGTLNVGYGKGSRRKGPKSRLVLLINGADRDLCWFIQDVWGQFDVEHARPGAPRPGNTPRYSRATPCRTPRQFMLSGSARPTAGAARLSGA